MDAPTRVAAVHRAALEREMDEEYRSHIQHRVDDLERRGLAETALS